MGTRTTLMSPQTVSMPLYPLILRSDLKRMNRNRMTSPPLNLLLIEDDSQMAQTYIWLMERVGVFVTAVPTIALADQMIKENESKFDAILLDLGLPDANGIDAVKMVRKCTDTPIVVLTGVDDPDDMLAEDAVAEGVQDWLPKIGTSGPQIVRSVRLAIARDKISRARNMIDQSEFP